MQDMVSRPWPRRFAFRCATALACTLAILVDAPAWAQPAGTSPVTSTPSARPKATRPTWRELSQEQQQALQPLASHWETLAEDRKRKWLALSQNYHAMSAAEQARLHGRMREWVQLSQQQRTQARLNFAETQQLTPEQKSAQWQAYQQLSAEEKRRLAAKAPPKPSGVAVVRPVPAEKLPQLAAPPPPKREKEAAAPSPINRHTLLPQPAAAAVPGAPAASPVVAPATAAEPTAPATPH